MSYKTRNQDMDKAAKVLARWQRANQSPAAQERLIADRERLWRLARDLANAIDYLLTHAQSSRDQ